MIMYRFKRKYTEFKHKLFAPLLGTVTSVRTRKPLVALTFDDGPDERDTPELLELLDCHNAKATFFVLGMRAAKHPELIRRMFQSGHTLANHGWSHTSMPTLSSQKRREEILKTHKILQPYGSNLFRPPYGHLDWPAYYDIKRCGHLTIAWNIVGHDWLDHSDEDILTRIVKKLKPGSIILLHDSLYTFEKNEHRNRRPMLSALDQLLKKVSGQFSFVTVPQLLKNGTLMKTYWFEQGDPQWLKRQVSLKKE